MSIFKKEQYEWEIETTTPTDYELTIKLKSQTKLFNLLFQRAKITLRRKHQIKVVQDQIDKIEHFSMNEIPLPQMYYNTVRTAIKSIYNDLWKIFKEDGIELMSNNVDNVKYIRRKDKKIWDIIITVSGQYIDKREVKE